MLGSSRCGSWSDHCVQRQFGPSNAVGNAEQYHWLPHWVRGSIGRIHSPSLAGYPADLRGPELSLD